MARRRKYNVRTFEMFYSGGTEHEREVAIVLA